MEWRDSALRSLSGAMGGDELPGDLLWPGETAATALLATPGLAEGGGVGSGG